MGDLVRAVRFSIRSLARSPGFTVPALLILAIGMTAATAIFTVVDSVVFRPLAYPEAGRLVLVCEEHPQISRYCVASPASVEDLREGSRTLAALGFGRSWQYSMDDGTGSVGVRGGIASPGFFQALGATPSLGRLFNDDEAGPDSRVVVLSHAFWTTRYGADPSVLGNTIHLDGEPFTVVGVLAGDFEAPFDMAAAQVWRPPHFYLTDPEVRGWRGFSAVGRLAAGVDRGTANQELRGLYAGLAPLHEEIDDEWRLQVHGLLDVVVGDSRAVFLAFLGAAGLLLLIVCANVANLLLARGLGRRRELALRAALGAERLRLVAGILTESLVLTAMATAAAVVLAVGATKLLLVMAPPDIPRLDEVTMDVRVLAFAAVVSVLATVGFSVLPALRATSWDLSRTIKSGGTVDAASSSGRLRTGLVVAELALSVVLVATAALLTRSFSNYLRWDPGFDREGVVAVSAFMSPGKYETRADLIPFYREAEAALASVPGVTAVSSASAGPLFGGGDGSIPFATESWDGASELPAAAWYDVGPGFFAMLHLPLVRGREITDADALGAPYVVVVNEALAKVAWPDTDPLGRVIRIPDMERDFEVVGVVADVQPLTPGEPAQPALYWSNRQLGRWGTFFVVRTAGDPGAVTPALAEALQSLDPDLSLGTPRTLVAAEERALVRPRFQALVLLAFALAALALSAVGVYAVVSYAVARRVKEMGIRIALGAGSAQVIGIIMRSSLSVAGLGILLGLGGAVASARVVRGMVHGVDATDPLSLGLAALILLVTAAAAAYIPARRATGVDPLRAIQQE